jgi:hypothetical protein
MITHGLPLRSTRAPLRLPASVPGMTGAAPALVLVYIRDRASGVLDAVLGAPVTRNAFLARS